MTTPTIKNLSMVILMEHDLAAAVAWYKKLGLRLVFHLKDKWAEFEGGNIKVGLCPTDQEPFDWRTGLVFEVDDLMVMYATLKDSVSFLSEPLVAAHGIMVSVKDPGGNIIDFYQPTPEKLQEFVVQTLHEEKK